MTATRQIVRSILNRSCSVEGPCVMCRMASQNTVNTRETRAASTASGSGSKRTEDQFSTSSSSLTGSPRLSKSSKRPMTSVRESTMLQKVKGIVPRLTNDMHKGQCGRVAVFGGCMMYTGAPYFAAISALKCGADLVHVFCEKEAGTVIKSYSPELIVHPVLDAEYGMEEIDSWLPRVNCVVIGPGLGRNQSMLGRISLILEKVKSNNVPIVIDADGLWHLAMNPGIIKGYKRAVITPNAMEFSRLVKAVLLKDQSPTVNPNPMLVEELAKTLGHITVIHKGNHDIISNGTFTESCSTGGSPRRCGGQGDLLSGSLATFLHWSNKADDCPDPGAGVIAGWAACRLTRGCASQAYNECGRSVTTTDLIRYIHPEFTRLYENETFL